MYNIWFQIFFKKIGADIHRFKYSRLLIIQFNLNILKFQIKNKHYHSYTKYILLISLLLLKQTLLIRYFPSISQFING